MSAPRRYGQVPQGDPDHPPLGEDHDDQYDEDGLENVGDDDDDDDDDGKDGAAVGEQSTDHL